MSKIYKMNTRRRTGKSLSRLLVFMGFLLLFFLTGCAASRLDLSLNHSGEFSKQICADRSSVTIGVDNFVDLRPQMMGSDEKKWLGMIPGTLWLELSSDLPELYLAFSPFNSRPFSSNVGLAVTEAVARECLSQEVVYLPDDPYRKIDFRLEGVLRRSQVQETGYYYGSTIYVWVARLLGLPYVSYEVALEVELRLRSLTTGEVIWQGRVAGARTDRYHTIYSLARGINGKHPLAYNFTEILNSDLPRQLAEMRKILAPGK